ncbi:2'-5' RNA ligase family protein [Corynebacterium comes]|uniref:2',5' RNA ligase family n=1 Tax=Corynebacterium comes TaxID=2675218 RepID=A0A6B8W335_9CORY|nr:2'-5' RNA ligase family protein [Corynebacterium comes]QGU04170.1 2',5' RNA ligase family [Corynebacterium comes]
MTSPDNILLYLTEDEEQQVREVFARLEQQGFPAQRQTPHITITFSSAMPGDVVRRAADLLPPLIPARFERVGTVVFGTQRKQTVAWLLETSDELEIAAREISELNPHGRGPRWIPHLTMGLRLPREIVPDYIRALNEVASSHLKELTAVRAALWRPGRRELTVLAGVGFAEGTDLKVESGPGGRP